MKTNLPLLKNLEYICHRFITCAYYIFLILYLSHNTFIQAQVMEWGKLIPGHADQIEGDTHSNVFVAQHFIGTVLHENKTYISNGQLDFLISKYTDIGKHLWTIQIGGTQQDSLHSMSFQRAGFIWLTGHFQGQIQVGNFTLTSAGLQDIFLIQVDAGSGLIKNALSIGGNGIDAGIAVKSNDHGELTLMAHYTGTINFGNTSLPGSGNQDILISRWDTALQLIWAKSIRGSADEVAETICLDKENGVILAGKSGSINVNLAGNLSQWSPPTHFILRMDSSGNPDWHLIADFDGRFIGIGQDTAGYIYLTGQIRSTFEYGSTTLFFNSSDDDLLLAKINLNHSFYWVKRYGGVDNEKINGFLVHPNGDLSLSGELKGNFYFGGMYLPLQTQASLYYARLDPNGDAREISLPTTNTQSSGKAVCLSENKAFFLAGRLNGPGAFKMGDTTLLTSGNETAFMKIHYQSNMLKGKIFLDDNQNMIQDPGDKLVEMAPFISPSGRMLKSDEKGEFSCLVNSGYYQLNTLLPSVGNNNPGICGSNIRTGTINGLGKRIQLQDFPYCQTKLTNLLSVQLIAMPIIKPGSDFEYIIRYQNRGNNHLPIYLTLNLDSNVQVIQAENFPSHLTSTLLQWDLGVVQGYTKGEIRILCRLGNSFTEGDSILSDLVMDVKLGSPSFLFRKVLHQAKIQQADWSVHKEFARNKERYCTIYFNNILEDSVNSILILDTILKPIYPESIYLLESSRPTRLLYPSDSSILIRMDEANLSNFAQNPFNSWGYVIFEYGNWLIHYLDPDTLLNRANCIFDYNEPIASPMAMHIIYKYSESQSDIETLPFEVYPNPNKGRYTLHFGQSGLIPEEIKLINPIGITIRTIENPTLLEDNSFVLNQEDLAPGVYYIWVRCAEGIFSKAVVMIR
jgi:hypothetical protein